MSFTIEKRLAQIKRLQNRSVDFHARQYEMSKKEATHVRLDKNGEIDMYYILKEVKYDNGTSAIRPKYLNCWGGYSFHSKGSQVDKKIIELLLPIN